MTTRAMGPGSGLGWITRAANLGGRNPKAIFGGAALLLAAILAVAIVLGVAMAGIAAGATPGSTTAYASSLLVTVPILLVMACLMVGYLRLIHAAETGQPAAATDILQGFRDFRTSLQAFGFMLLLMVVQNLVLFGLLKLVSPETLTLYMQGMQMPAPDAAQAMPVLPEGFGAAMALMWLIALLVYAVQAIGIGQIALGGRSLGAALGDGASGAFKNLPALLVLLAVMIAAVIAAVVVGMLMVLLLGVLVKLLGTWIAVVLGVPLYLALLLVMIVVAFGVMYFMWRDVCGDAAPTAAQAADSLEL